PGRRKRLRTLVGERVKRITVKPFMDINTMIEERLTQCCVHVGMRSAEQDQCAPFCAVQAWAPLGAGRLSAVAAEPSRRVLPLTVAR
ncbi:MAG: radical SAM protein, partial [Candidatus Dormibacter sp.]